MTGRAAKATDPVDADPTLAPVAVAADGSVAAAPRSTKLSPAAKKVLKGSALAAAAAAVGKLVVAKIAERPAAPPAPAPPAPAPAEPDAADAAEPDAPAEEAVAPAGADDDAAAADDGAAPVPGMSPEAAARLAEAKLREELLGRVEGQYKLRGETCPLSVQKQTVAELEATLAELRGERAAGDGGEWWWRKTHGVSCKQATRHFAVAASELTLGATACMGAGSCRPRAARYAIRVEARDALIVDLFGAQD